jgi:hypothetical protein
MSWLWIGGNGPTGLPQAVYSYLVLTLKADPDSVGRLKYVQQAGFVNRKSAVLMRVFDPVEAEKVVVVKDFASLDHHPEVVRYEGYVKNGDGKVHLAATLKGGSGASGQT